MAYSQKYYEDNKDTYLKRAEEWAQNNRERVRKNHLRWSDQNREKCRENERRYRKNNPVKVLLNRTKQRAKKNQWEFDLEMEDIIIPETCPFLEIPLSFGGDRWNTPSIDRIDPQRGYIKGNIQIMSWRANFLKSNASLEELLLLSTNITNYLLGEV